MNAAPRTPWLTVAVLAGAGVAVALHVGKVPGAIPLLRADLGLGLTAAGWVVSIFNLVAAGAGLAVGLAADRYGQARVALAGMLLVALASALGAAAANAFVLLASRAIEGVGFILTAVSVPSLITQTAAPADRRVALGLWGANVPLGIGAMLLLGAPLLGSAGWRGVWLLAAALTLAAALALFLVTRGGQPRARTEQAPLTARLRELATRRGPWVLAAIFALYAGQYLAVVGFLPLILVEVDGASAPAAAALSALVVLANVLGNLAAGFALRAGARPQRLLTGASIAMAAGAALVFFAASGPWLRVAGGLLFSAVGGLIPGSLFALAPEHAPRPQLLSSVNGLMMQGSAAGQFALPPLAAALATAGGGWNAAAAATLLAATAVVALARLLRPR